VPAKQRSHLERFDYGDIADAQSLYVQIGEVALLAVLNDSCGALNVERNIIDPVTGPLSPLQQREIMARLSYANLRLRKRPVFIYDFGGESYRMIARVPRRVEVDTGSGEEYGKLLYHATRMIVDGLGTPHSDEIRRRVRAGTFTFLVDERGEFLADSMDLPSD